MIGVVSDESASLAIIIFPLKSILASIASNGFSPTFLEQELWFIFSYWWCCNTIANRCLEKISRTITYRLTVHIKHHLIPENSKMNLVPFIREDLWDIPCHGLNAPIVFRNRKFNSFTSWVEPYRKLWRILTKKWKHIVNLKEYL